MRNQHQLMVIFHFSQNGPALPGNNATVKLLNNSTKTLIHHNEYIYISLHQIFQSSGEGGKLYYNSNCKEYCTFKDISLCHHSVLEF